MTTASRTFPLVLGLAAAGTAAVVVGLAALPSGGSAGVHARAASAPARPCPKPPTGVSLAQARTVANLFIEHAVLRVRPECSYGLVAPDLHAGLTRADWAAGRIPFETFDTAFKKVDRAAAVRVALPRELGLWVFLEAPDVGRRAYELVLVRRAGRWIVDYWGETLDPTSPPFPAPAEPAATSSLAA